MLLVVGCQYCQYSLAWSLPRQLFCLSYSAMPSNVDDTDYQKESPEAQSWLKYQVDAELQRISEQGSRAIPLPVKNMGVVVEPKPNKKSLIVINRIEIGTGMDFNRIKQIMVSEPKPYPFNKTGSAEYVHVSRYFDLALANDRSFSSLDNLSHYLCLMSMQSRYSIRLKTVQSQRPCLILSKNGFSSMRKELDRDIRLMIGANRTIQHEV